ncbi:unnamed protein product [Sphagnum tenellum]
MCVAGVVITVILPQPKVRAAARKAGTSPLKKRRVKERKRTQRSSRQKSATTQLLAEEAFKPVENGEDDEEEEEEDEERKVTEPSEEEEEQIGQSLQQGHPKGLVRTGGAEEEPTRAAVVNRAKKNTLSSRTGEPSTSPATTATTRGFRKSKTSIRAHLVHRRPHALRRSLQRRGDFRGRQRQDGGRDQGAAPHDGGRDDVALLDQEEAEHCLPRED